MHVHLNSPHLRPLLLELGVDPTRLDNPGDALHAVLRAIYIGFVEQVQAVVAHQDQPDRVDTSGATSQSQPTRSTAEALLRGLESEPPAAQFVLGARRIDSRLQLEELRDGFIGLKCPEYRLQLVESTAPDLVIVKDREGEAIAELEYQDKRSGRHLDVVTYGSGPEQLELLEALAGKLGAVRIYYVEYPPADLLSRAIGRGYHELMDGSMGDTPLVVSEKVLDSHPSA